MSRVPLLRQRSSAYGAAARISSQRDDGDDHNDGADLHTQTQNQSRRPGPARRGGTAGGGGGGGGGGGASGASGPSPSRTAPPPAKPVVSSASSSAVATDDHVSDDDDDDDDSDDCGGYGADPEAQPLPPKESDGLGGLFMPFAATQGEIGLEGYAGSDSSRSASSSPLDDDDDYDDGSEDDGASRPLRRSFSYGTSPAVPASIDTGIQPADGSGLSPVKSRSDENPVDNSPYPQVRASVSAVDDLSLSINTPRMWSLSIAFAVLGSATNLFFSLRYPSVSISPVIALLLVHPLGLLWDRLLKRSSDPAGTFVLGQLSHYDRPSSRASNDWTPTDRNPPPSSLSRPERLRLWLAQGRWNEKEHACVYISSNVSFGFAFATDVIVEQTKFYMQDATITYQLLLIISTQVLGYAMAGLTRRYLVRPGGMIWPATLIPTAMFSTLHKNENLKANGWRISRWKFFLVVFLAAFAWHFVPGLLMPSLSYFNVVTWLAPESVPVANFFGTASGLGMFPLTFDWSQIAYTGSPLVVPFWAALNVAGGLVFVMWFLAPIMYYTNALYSSFMPILSASVFDNTGGPYDVTRILTSDFLFDEAAYRSYSPVFLPITYVLSYAAQFASITALLVHTFLWHGRDIATQWRRSLAEARSDARTEASYRRLSTTSAPPSPLRTRSASFPALDASTGDLASAMNVEDVHNRLMRRYDDVPYTWYLAVGLLMLATGIFTVEYYPVHLPWWGLILAAAICALLFIPIGIVMAITAQQSSIYLLCQLVCGFLFPGRPVANMIFVTYGYITSTQGLKFSADLKLGHYMKIPPRILFSVQVIATLVASFTQAGVLNWMLANIRGICTPWAINGFSCPLARVHFNGSILWGVLGPSRFLGSGGMYRALLWAFPLGVVLPLVPYYLSKRSARKASLRSRHHRRRHRDVAAAATWQKVNLPVILGSLSWIPPATGLNFSVWTLVCFAFNHVLKRRRQAWWRKYNMTLSAALDAGVAFGVAVIFFAIVYPGYADGFSWWGTEVYKQGCDWTACPLQRVPPGQRFGPDRW